MKMYEPLTRSMELRPEREIQLKQQIFIVPAGVSIVLCFHHMVRLK